jgi:hypothetical protein
MSNERAIPIGLAQEMAKLVWPRFVQHDGLILVDLSGRYRVSGKRIARRPDLGLDNTGLEAFQNHTHVLDLFKHDSKVWRSRPGRFDRRHPHFRLAERIGVVIAESWFAKLRRDFPEDRFRVYYTRLDDPIVRFHRVYPREPMWLDDDQCESTPGARVWDTRQAQGSGQPSRFS